jgi:hypothetical protein
VQLLEFSVESAVIVRGTMSADREISKKFFEVVDNDHRIR